VIFFLLDQILAIQAMAMVRIFVNRLVNYCSSKS
jgi:hypothetical protein